MLLERQNILSLLLVLSSCEIQVPTLVRAAEMNISTSSWWQFVFTVAKV